LRVLAPLLALLAGCESGLARSVKVTIPDEVSGRFSAAAPGLVVSDLGAEALAYVALCGQHFSREVYLSQDLGFGCLEEARAGRRETVRVWVQAVPSDLDGARLCAEHPERSFYRGFPVDLPDGGATDGGVTSALAGEPLADWPQGRGEGAWRRDGSPCGGVLNAVVVVTVP
jgi:hypothetical protein